MHEILAGRNAVREALRAGRRQAYSLWRAEGASGDAKLADVDALAKQRGLVVQRVARHVLDRLTGGAPHQGVALEVSPYRYAGLEEILEIAAQRGEEPLLLILDSVQDPQNVGSLLRTAEAVGAHGVVIPQRRAAGITPAVSRASAGSVEHLRVTMVTNLARAIEDLKRRGVWAVGVEDRLDAQDYGAADLARPLALVMGGEGEGLGRLVAQRCDLLVRIPMRGQINSLNVAVAGALVLYRAWQARRESAR